MLTDIISFLIHHLAIGICGVIMSPPTHLPKGDGGTYCFWDGSRWRRRKHRHRTSCPLCNLNTLWNILMILGRNVEQDQTTYRVQERQLCLSYFWSYHPLFEKKKFLSALQLKYPLEYFNGTWQKCRTGPDHVSHTRMTTLPFLLLVLSPFIISDNDNPLISCPLCKSKILWNIFMILGRNVEQDQTMCHVQEWQLCLSYFWSYLPLLCLTVIIHWFHVCSVSQRPFGIFLWYLVEM